MSQESLFTLIFGGALVVGIAASVMLWYVYKMVREGRESNISQQAAARGWQTEAVDEGGDRVMRYRGSTDGVAWTAEARRSQDQRRDTRPQLARWQAAARGPASPVLILREGSDMTRVVAATSGELGSLVAGLAQMGMDKGIDKLFGAEAGRAVDGAKLERVAGVNLPHFLVLAHDSAEAVRIMKAGVGDAVASVARQSGSVLSESDAPALLLTPVGVYLGRRTALPPDDVQRFAQAGTAIVRQLPRE